MKPWKTLLILGQAFLGAPLEFGDIKKDDNSAMSKIEITLSNVALGISGIIGVRGDVVTGAPALIRRVFLNVNANEILSEGSQILWAGKCNNLQLDYEDAKMDIETPLGGYEIMAPAAKYRPTCQVRRFKDCRCQYTFGINNMKKKFLIIQFTLEYNLDFDLFLVSTSS